MKLTAEQLTGQTESHLIDILVGQKSFLVHPGVSADLLALKQAADSAGFNLNIASGFRSFDRQLAIWNRKMSGEAPILDEQSSPLDIELLNDDQKVRAILRWSALPGASRHHWGTDFDIFDRSSLPENTTLKLEPWEYLQAHQHAFYLWLNDNLHKFGFFFPYQETSTGVAFEPWHISHIKCSRYCLEALNCELLATQLEAAPILGKESVQQYLPEIYNKYITNISDHQHD